jgi:hypothetical protein
MPVILMSIPYHGSVRQVSASTLPRPGHFVRVERFAPVRALSVNLPRRAITRLDVATSRPLPGEGPRRRVQHVIREERATVAQWTRDGAHVYLSGRLSMGREVGELFVELLESEGFAENAEGARALLDRWRTELRFQASVSGV